MWGINGGNICLFIIYVFLYSSDSLICLVMDNVPKAIYPWIEYLLSWLLAISCTSSYFSRTQALEPQNNEQQSPESRVTYIRSAAGWYPASSLTGSRLCRKYDCVEWRKYNMTYDCVRSYYLGWYIVERLFYNSCDIANAFCSYKLSIAIGARYPFELCSSVAMNSHQG